MAKFLAECLEKVRLLRRREVEQRTRLSRSAIYRRMDRKDPSHDPDFPLPIPVGSSRDPWSAVAWVESEVDRYIALQIEKARGSVLGMTSDVPIAPRHGRPVKRAEKPSPRRRRSKKQIEAAKRAEGRSE